MFGSAGLLPVIADTGIRRSFMENKKVSIIIMIALAACAAVFAGLYFFTVFSSIPQKNYTEAVAFYELKNYEAAEAKFRDLGSYRDSAEYLEKISVERTYDHAVKAYEAGDFETSKELFSQIGDYEDSGAYLKKIDYIFVCFCFPVKCIK